MWGPKPLVRAGSGPQIQSLLDSLMNTATATAAKTNTGTLLDMMNAVDLTAIKFPTEKIEDKEISVGPMSDGLKRIYHLFSLSIYGLVDFQKESRAKGKAHRKMHSLGEIGHHESDCMAFNQEMNERKKEESRLIQKVKALRAIFWNAVNIEHPELYEKSHVAVREGGCLVWMDKKEESDPLVELLREFLSETDLFSIFNAHRSR
jgi:hypothetical protein